ncbi:MAG: DUF3108 domain-containing protein [Kofleriaceae bacterium]
MARADRAALLCRWPAHARLVLGAAALAVAASCASTAEAFTQPPAAAPAPVGELGLLPGETMAFVVKLAGLEVGEAALAVGERGAYEGHPALTVRSKIGTTGAARLLRAADDESTTVINLATGAPLRLDTHVLMGGQETFTKALFAPDHVDVEVRRTGVAGVRAYTFGAGDGATLDAHAAMAHLRGWRPARGTSRTVWLVGGRRLWRVDLAYAGDETIGTEQGNRKATRLDGVAYRAQPDRSLDESKPPRRFSVWMSDDADRVPLRVSATTEYGEIELELVDYQRP